MRPLCVVTILIFAAPGWAQSLADIARADREREKPRARKVITNENLQNFAVEEKSAAEKKDEPEPTDPLQRELYRVRHILRGICADPRTESGSNLSNDDKQAMNEGVKPLRARVQDFELSRKKYNEALAAVDREFEPRIIKAVYTGREFTDADLQRVKALRQEHDARQAALTQQFQREVESFKAMQQQVEAVIDECPAAAAAVPD